MHIVSFILTVVLAVSFNKGIAQNNFTDDKAMYDKLRDNLRKLYDNGECVEFETLNKQLKNNKAYLNLNSKGIKPTDNGIYSSFKKGVLVIGKLFHLNNSNADRVYTASGFVIDESGICVTNHHVFEKNDKINSYCMAAMDYEGNVYPITKIIASKDNDDVAIFKIKTHGKKLNSLRLGNNAKVGDRIHVISHPRALFYSYSTGVISRHYLYHEENSIRMSITADFAVGSSGGPILNDKGEVVGVVSATMPIPNRKEPQMILKEIIPVKSLKDIIKK